MNARKRYMCRASLNCMFLKSRDLEAAFAPLPARTTTAVSEGCLALRCSWRLLPEDGFLRLKQQHQLLAGDSSVLLGGFCLERENSQCCESCVVQGEGRAALSSWQQLLVPSTAWFLQENTKTHPNNDAGCWKRKSSLPVRWKVNDGVEFALPSCRAFFHFNVPAALCYHRRGAVASPLCLCLLQAEQLCGSRRDPHRLGPWERIVPCQGKPQVRARIRKQQHSHHSSGGGAVFFSGLLIRATGRRGAQNNHVGRGVFMAKDTVIIKRAHP